MRPSTHTIALLSAATLTLSSMDAMAQEITKEHRADVVRLFSEVLTEEVWRKQGHIILPAIRAGLQKGNLRLSDKALDILSSELEAAMESIFKEPTRFGESIADSFAREFSHDEVKHILSFVLSRAGQKWQKLTSGGDLSQRAFAEWVAASMPDICRRANLRLQKENLAELPPSVCSRKPVGLGQFSPATRRQNG